MEAWKVHVSAKGEGARYPAENEPSGNLEGIGGCRSRRVLNPLKVGNEEFDDAHPLTERDRELCYIK